MERDSMKNWEKWAIVILAIVLLGGNFVYFKFYRGKDNDPLRKRNKTELPIQNDTAPATGTADTDPTDDAVAE